MSPLNWTQGRWYRRHCAIQQLTISLVDSDDNMLHIRDRESSRCARIVRQVPTSKEPELVWMRILNMNVPGRAGNPCFLAQKAPATLEAQRLRSKNAISGKRDTAGEGG